jgi:hypothetical protein
MKKNWIVFVDTNILLDFYRLRGASAVKYLQALEQNRTRLILTEQVYMEFLKHRQRVVVESLNEIKKPTEQKLPPFLENYQPALGMKRSSDDAVSHYRKIVSKIDSVISNPSSHDEVYKSLTRVFKTSSPYYLNRDVEFRNRIRSQARKRFSLGYPPKKKDDTSVGDAINWEWIVHCASVCAEKSNVIIVSRDGDFGITRGGKSYLNDWLRREFQERVSRKRSIELTELLSVALKKIEVPVDKAMVEDEKTVAGDMSLASKRMGRLAEFFSSENEWPEISERMALFRKEFSSQADVSQRLRAMLYDQSIESEERNDE